MVAKNDITGDAIQSRKNSQEFEEGHERIFGKRKTNGGWTPPSAVTLEFSNLPPRAKNSLTENWNQWRPVHRNYWRSINSIEELLTLSETDLLRRPNFGRGTVINVKALLAEHGLSLRADEHAGRIRYE